MGKDKKSKKEKARREERAAAAAACPPHLAPQTGGLVPGQLMVTNEQMQLVPYAPLGVSILVCMQVCGQVFHQNGCIKLSNTK